MTCLFGFVVFLIYITAQGLAMIPIPAAYAAGGTPPDQLDEVAMSGMNLAFATAAGCPVLLLSCGLLAWARQGPRIGDYLAIRRVSLRRLIGWILLIVVVGCGCSIFNDFFERPAPEFIVNAYGSSGYAPWFWAAIVICAPVGEETLFRGFLFAGWSASRLRRPGTVLLTTFLFSLIHVGQYGWVDLAQLTVIGLCFGIARAVSGSLLPPIAMHIALNFTSLFIYALTRGVR